ncbi:hypothetical protein [Phreatobacter sp.]|nr:hypothetical protein [Phreatobacter sp.]
MNDAATIRDLEAALEAQRKKLTVRFAVMIIVATVAVFLLV